MTQGIVSNAGRQVKGVTMIQTSAAVNPGSSGGPMFNSHGLVMGLVTLKASIEGAGFAVPTSDLTAFLIDACETTGPAGRLRRYWYDASGKQRVDATYGGSTTTHVQLIDLSNQEFSVPISKLSDNDQKFVHWLNSRNR